MYSIDLNLPESVLSKQGQFITGISNWFLNGFQNSHIVET